MARYLIRRLLYTFITLVGISVISWVIITQAPGSPIAITMDPKVSPKIVEQMEKNYDLDKPIYQQYFLWLKRLFTGNLYSGILARLPSHPRHGQTLRLSCARDEVFRDRRSDIAGDRDGSALASHASLDHSGHRRNCRPFTIYPLQHA